MIPTHRAPSHPGEILRHEFRKPLALTQEQLAEKLAVSFKTINAIECGRQGITAEMALRLARCLKTTPDLWMNLQMNVELWAIEHSPVAREIRQLRPLRMALNR